MAGAHQCWLYFHDASIAGGIAQKRLASSLTVIVGYHRILLRK